MHIDTSLKIALFALLALLVMSVIPAIPDFKGKIQPIDLTLKISYSNVDNKYPLYISDLTKMGGEIILTNIKKKFTQGVLLDKGMIKVVFKGSDLGRRKGFGGKIFRNEKILKKTIQIDESGVFLHVSETEITEL